MEQLTTYTIKSKNSNNIWEFKYHLNGVLYSFKALDGVLSVTQIEWLFVKANFPYKEDQIKDWQKKLKANFEITVGEPQLSFETLWILYDNKVKKFEAIKAFNKLKEPDIIRCFLSVPGYNKYLQRKGIAKAHLSSFINKRYFDDDWNKAK